MPANPVQRPTRVNASDRTLNALHAPLWPGITRGFDARCGCTWAPGMGGVYEVKVRWLACPVHAGDLAACLARMERARDVITGRIAG